MPGLNLITPYVGIKIFAGPRGSGKTTALLRWVAEKPDARRMVVKNEVRKQFAETLPEAKGVRIWTFNHCNTRGWKSYVALGVDDYDQLIHDELRIGNDFGHQVKAIALESEDYINLRPPRPKLPLPLCRESTMNSTQSSTTHKPEVL